jgi:hypothetical protein
MPTMPFGKFVLLLRLVSMLLRFGICKAKGVVVAKAKGRLRGLVECLCMVVLRRFERCV